MKNLEKIKELISDNSEFEALELFTKETYAKEYDKTFNEMFETIFKDSVKLSEAYPDISKSLTSLDEKERLKAARFIRNEAYNESSIMRQRWLANPFTINELLLSLKQETSDKVAIEFARALSMIIKRYHFLDKRIFDQFCVMYDNAKKNLKAELIVGISSFDFEEKWDLIVDFSGKKPNEYGQSAIAMSILKSEVTPKTVVEKMLPMLFIFLNIIKEGRFEIIKAIGKIGDEDAAQKLKEFIVHCRNNAEEEIVKTAIDAIQNR